MIDVSKRGDDSDIGRIRSFHDRGRFLVREGRMDGSCFKSVVIITSKNTW